jgi:CheY-like chemotaxis protein
MAVLLVVDDDTEALGAMCAVLTAVGHNVVPAESGFAPSISSTPDKQALDLMLTDIAMPGLHGFNLSRMARRRRRRSWCSTSPATPTCRQP